MNIKQLIQTTIIAAALTCSGVTVAQAQELEGGALANWFIADNSRDDTNNGFGLALDAIHFWNSYEGLSLRLSFANLETDMPIETDFQRYTGTIGYWRYLDGDGFMLSGFRPYVNAAIGFGIQETVTTKANSDSGLLLEAAFGLVSTWDVLIPNLKFRPELRLDYETVYSDAVDLTVGAGLHYSFGAPRMAEPAPVYVPVPPAPRAVKPAPAPAPVVAKDNDGDGVNNDDDACPGTAKGAAVDSRGCVQIEKVVLKGVSFGSGSATLKPEAFGELRAVAAAMKANPKLKVEVGGHSDSMGDDKKNQALSEKRAGSIKSFLIKEGVAGDRISVKGYGESKPVDTNDTPEGRSNNRRVEFNVLN